MFQLIESRAMEIMDCNNIVKSASIFFKGGCAVNVLTDKHNPLGELTDIKILFCIPSF